MTVLVCRDKTRNGMAWDTDGVNGSDSLYLFIGDDPFDDEHIRTKPFFCGCSQCRIFQFRACRAPEFTGTVVSHTIRYRNCGWVGIKATERTAERELFAHSVQIGDALVLCHADDSDESLPFWFALAGSKPYQTLTTLNKPEHEVAVLIRKNQWCVRIGKMLTVDASNRLKHTMSDFADEPGWESDYRRRAPRIQPLDAIMHVKVRLDQRDGAYFLADSDLAGLLNRNFSRYAQRL